MFAGRAHRAGTGAVARATAAVLAWAFVFVGVTSPSAAAPPLDGGGGAVAAFERMHSSLVTVAGLRSAGHEGSAASKAPLRVASGIVYDAKGLVVTVASAVRDCDVLLVRDEAGIERDATLVGVDEATGIALLRVAPSTADARYPALVPASAENAGTVAIAMAAESGRHPVFTEGVVRRRYERPLGTILLLSNDVFPGYSGGLVATPAGELLGIILGRLEEVPPDWADAPRAGEAASFALAAKDLATIVRHLDQYGRVRRGFLGVRMVQGEVVDQNRPDDPFRIGVRVEDVLPDSPAARVDLRKGDLIVGWNGETLLSPEDLMRRVEGSPPGTVVPLVWVRDEERREGRLVVGETPETNLLATPATPDPATLERRRNELVERVRALRTRPPQGAPSGSPAAPASPDAGRRPGG